MMDKLSIFDEYMKHHSDAVDIFRDSNTKSQSEGFGWCDDDFPCKDCKIGKQCAEVKYFGTFHLGDGVTYSDFFDRFSVKYPEVFI